MHDQNDLPTLTHNSEICWQSRAGRFTGVLLNCWTSILRYL